MPHCTKTTPWGSGLWNALVRTPAFTHHLPFGRRWETIKGAQSIRRVSMAQLQVGNHLYFVFLRQDGSTTVKLQCGFPAWLLYHCLAHSQLPVAQTVGLTYFHYHRVDRTLGLSHLTQLSLSLCSLFLVVVFGRSALYFLSLYLNFSPSF